MKTTAIFPLIFILSLTPLFSQNNSDSFNITLDNADSQALGYQDRSSSGESPWAPFLGSVADKIYIPDFYKARIAVFELDGTWLEEILLKEGLNPSMGFFDRNDEGQFLTYSNRNLFLFDSRGEKLWQKELPVSFRPSRTQWHKDYLFLLGQDQNDKTLVLDRNNGALLGTMGLEADGQIYPLFLSDSNASFCFRLEGMGALDLWDGMGTQGEFLFFVNRDESLWAKEESGGYRFYRYSVLGELLEEQWAAAENVESFHTREWALVPIDSEIRWRLYWFVPGDEVLEVRWVEFGGS